MSKHLTWYKRCPADWQRGTRKHGMSFQLRGFYSECLDVMWELRAQLPKDEKKLAMLLGTNARMVRSLMPQLIALGKMIETDLGYYNRRMMADILGLDDVKPAGQFEPTLNSVHAPVVVDSTTSRERVNGESTAKIEKNPAITTRDLEAEAEAEEEKKEQGAVACAPHCPLPTNPRAKGTAPRQRGGVDEISLKFEQWWAVFPAGRKRGKGKCRELFVKIAAGRHTNLKASAETMIEAAQTYAAKRPNAQFVPMPLTWLNQGRWEDNPAESFGFETPNRPQANGVPAQPTLTQILAERRAAYERGEVVQ